MSDKNVTKIDYEVLVTSAMRTAMEIGASGNPSEARPFFKVVLNNVDELPTVLQRLAYLNWGILHSAALPDMQAQFLEARQRLTLPPASMEPASPQRDPASSKSFSSRRSDLSTTAIERCPLRARASPRADGDRALPARPPPRRASLSSGQR